MAVGIYTLPICDGCKLPWLPVGWTQDSDPRNLREGAKPLRCGKCKSIGWDREFVKQQKADATEIAVNPFDPTKTIELPRNVALDEALSELVAVEVPAAMGVDGDIHPPRVLYENVPRGTLDAPKARCKHRLTDCPICHPKEAA